MNVYFSIMNQWFAVVLLSTLFFFACGNKKRVPDVSHIKVDVTIKRFEQDFFAIDTSHLEASLNKLQQQYGAFLNDYLYNILSLPSVPDSVVKNVKLFIRDYKPVYDSAEQQFASFSKQQSEIQHGLQLAKYYFPTYQLPKQIITYIGPFEGYSNVLTSSGIAIGLQLYLGLHFSAYQTNFFREVYPDYQSRRFEEKYIPVSSLTNIINDIYPPKSSSKTLIETVVEEGKRAYLLDALLPETADTLKTGYTASQLQGCYDNEAAIWNFFIENNLLYTNDPSGIRDYTNDAPRTEALGPNSPGNIGLFIGWQIVKKWMNDKGDKVSMEQLLQTEPKQIFTEAKYKPK